LAVLSLSSYVVSFRPLGGALMASDATCSVDRAGRP
jgi:hypothetical protein